MKEKNKKLIVVWREKKKEAPKVVFAGCGGGCYSGTCSSCKN